MSAFLQEHQDEINEEWYEYCHEIQQVRRKYNMPDLVFTQGDKDFFAQKYIERRLHSWHKQHGTETGGLRDIIY